MEKKKRSRHKSEPDLKTPADKTLQGYSSEPEWRTGYELPVTANTIVKPSTDEKEEEKEKSNQPTPQEVHQTTPTKPPCKTSKKTELTTPTNQPLRRSSRQKTPSKSPAPAPKRTKLSKFEQKNNQAVCENATMADKPCTKKRTIISSHEPSTCKESKDTDIKKNGMNIDNKMSKKRTQSASSENKQLTVGSKVRNKKSESVDSKPPISDVETRPKRKRKMIENGSRKPAGRNKKGTAGRKAAKRKAPRGPLPSFDDDVFETLQPEQTAENNERNPTEREKNICEERTTSVSATDSTSNMADAADLEEFEIQSNQSSDDELPDVLSQDSKKINEGDIVWVKMRGFPYWPAVVKKVYLPKQRATILFSGDLNKSDQRGKGVSLKACKLYSCPEKEELIEAGLKNPKITKEDFQEAIDRAEDYITKRGLGKAQGASFFTIKDYSHTNGDTPDQSPTKLITLPYTPTLRAGSPLRDTPSSPLTPPFDSPCNGLMDSPNWKTGRPLSRNQDQSIDMEEEPSSDVDEELLEKRDQLGKLQTRLIRYITRRQQERVKEHLIRIFKGKEKSKRHELYFSPGSQPRNQLKYMRGFGPLTDDDKQDELMKFLRKVYEENCLKDPNDVVYTSYIADVWFPEAIIFALQRTRRICHKRAEELFRTEEKNAMEITGALDEIKLPSYLTEEEKRQLLDNVPLKAARQLGFSPRELGLS